MFIIEQRLKCGWFPPQYSSTSEYIHGTRMNMDRVWGTDCEMITMSDLLDTTIYSFNESSNAWTPYSPQSGIDSTVPALYIKFVNGDHFQVVTSVS